MHIRFRLVSVIYRKFCFSCFHIQKWFTGLRSLSGESLYFLCRYDFLVQYLLLAHMFDFLFSNCYNLEDRIGFYCVLLINSVQLYLPKFS